MRTIQLFVVSVLALVVGFVLTNAVVFNICTHDDYACRGLLNEIGDPLLYGSGALAVVFLALLYFKKAVPAWKKFAVWFVPLATLLFIFYPEPGAGDLFSPYPESVFKWVSGFYILISAIIVSYSVRTKR